MASDKFIYYMHRMTKIFPPSKEILKDISLSFFYGAKIGIVGTNGSGKSTLLKIMAGLDTDFQGEAWVEQGRTVGYLPQEPHLDPDKTVKENVELAVKAIKDLLDEFNEVSMKFGEDMTDDEMDKLCARQAELQDQIDTSDAWEIDRKLEIAMDALRCPPGDSPVTNLSGGEKRRVALCKLLLEAPDLLLLDEPTNHLDAESVAWLENHLRAFKGSVILVTHDRYFLDNVTGWVLELQNGRGIPWEGNYTDWLDQKTKSLAESEKQESSRQRRLKEELAWVRTNPKGRHTKNKARLGSYEQLLAQDSQKKSNETILYIPQGKRLGDKVINVSGLTKAFGEKLLFENLEFSLPRSGIVGIVGPNGAGKTTLLKMLLGMEEADSGTIDVGDTVDIISADQDRAGLNDEATVWEEITEKAQEVELGDRKMNSRAYCGLFNFTGTDQQKPVGKLSGGERNRVLMAKLIKRGGNVLVLDEPTNDLDVETLQSLEQAILNFAGCVLVTSHDRWFLNRIATHILAFESNSEVKWFSGTYDEYDDDRKKRLGSDAEIPHRIKYRTLTR
ncbi:MAG: energy-dependent translational throttle protein EttA [Fibrobacterales bacterium]